MKESVPPAESLLDGTLFHLRYFAPAQITRALRKPWPRTVEATTISSRPHRRPTPDTVNARNRQDLQRFPAGEKVRRSRWRSPWPSPWRKAICLAVRLDATPVPGTIPIAAPTRV
jgi:hypothetical protein